MEGRSSTVRAPSLYLGGWWFDSTRPYQKNPHDSRWEFFEFFGAPLRSSIVASEGWWSRRDLNPCYMDENHAS